VNTEVKSSFSGLFEGRVDGVRITGTDWASPLRLSCRALDFEVGAVAIDTDALVARYHNNHHHHHLDDNYDGGLKVKRDAKKTAVRSVGDCQSITIIIMIIIIIVIIIVIIIIVIIIIIIIIIRSDNSVHNKNNNSDSHHNFFKFKMLMLVS
jgi:hypothetical protein